MIFKPRQLGVGFLPEDELRNDRKHCRKFGPCGVGEKALYLNSFYFDRRYYVPIASVKRIFKRVAMSKGGFSGKGIFATIPYLVVEYDNGMEKQCNFKFEEQVDRMLEYIKERYPTIPVHSKEAERKLKERERRLAKKRAAHLTETAEENIRILKRASSYLEQDHGRSMELSIAARRKRTYDRSNPAYKWVALFITLMGIAALLYGVYALITRAGFGMYFLLFGLAAIFFFSGANVLPTARNNRSYIEKQLRDSIDAMSEYISAYPDFPVPAHYAHPIVLKRMAEILMEGRAQEITEAMELLKSDLKALNSSVQVEQEEYDEVVAIKPMFLIMDYKDEI